MSSLKVFSVGTSTRSIEEFIALLKEHGIRVAVDVRRFPTSRRFPHFRKEEIRRHLEASGLEYHWLGDRLGGFRPGGYEAWMKTQQFEEGLETLKDLASKAPTAFFCCERLPWRCHRRFIARRLQDEGWEVVHLY